MAIRNIAIIAHVDHGKTTLVDQLLTQSGTMKHLEGADLVMDNNDQERERGITIYAKNTAVKYDGNTINIIDTPGHADFGSEVERVLRMVDSVCLVVDAYEGPMPQTKFVLKKALELGIKPIVVINKIDRPGARPDWVINHTFDLFDKLGATDEQLDFPIIYGSAKNGWMSKDPTVKTTDMTALFETVLAHVPPPTVEPGPFRLLGTTIGSDPFLGRILTGRVAAGTVKVNQQINALDNDGNIVESGRASKLLAFVLQPLFLVGGLLLLYIGVKLVVPEAEGDEDGIAAKPNLWGAIQTIIVADAVMSLDNVVAIAAAAHGTDRPACRGGGALPPRRRRGRP